MNTKAKALLLTTAAGLATLLASCFGGGELDVTPDLTIDITADHSDITLRGVFPNFNWGDEKVKNGYLGQELQVETGWNISWEQLSATGGDTEVQSLLATSEPIDFMKLGPTLFNNYVADGYFTDLTDVIDKYGNVALDDEGTTLKNLYTQEQWDACSYNGKIYAIPEFGHTTYRMSTLVWNTEHLRKVGITKIPETLTEFNDAVYALQNYFTSDAEGVTDDQRQYYHAFGFTGNIALSNIIADVFGVPMNWYEGEDGKLHNMFYSTEEENYMRYLNKLYLDDIIVNDWVGQSESNTMDNFNKQWCSVYNGSYWNIKSLRKKLVGSYAFPDDGTIWSDAKKELYVRGSETCNMVNSDGLVGWRNGLTGDGSFGSKVQDEPYIRDSKAIGYYITVPITCCKRAAYVVDFVARKNTYSCASLVAGGKEGIHWDYCNAEDEGAIKLLCEEPTYVKKYDRYDEDISGMEQFQTGMNAKAARKWWPLAEAGFDAWSVMFVDDNGNEKTDHIITDPFAIHPVVESFSRYDLKAQNYVITKVQNCIKAKDDEDFETKYEKAKTEYNTKYYSNFADDISNWYNENKTN